jgi:hypothetical protein
MSIPTPKQYHYSRQLEEVENKISSYFQSLEDDRNGLYRNIDAFSDAEIINYCNALSKSAEILRDAILLKRKLDRQHSS